MPDRWTSIRAAAERERCSLPPRGPGAPAAVAETLLKQRGYDVSRLPNAHPLLSGAWAALLPDLELAVVDRGLTPERQAFALAHELGHLVVHAGGGGCDGGDIESQVSMLDALEGSLEIYNPRQRRELEANTFAVGLLAPPDLLRDLFVRRHLGARAIARRLGVTVPVIMNALADLLQGPAAVGAECVATPESDQGRPAMPPGPERREPLLDGSQLHAAHIRGVRALVQAGPGTGKTATLVGRVLHLIRDQGLDPRRVLVVTFSNRAAGELRERLTVAVGPAASSMTICTLHSFAHEVLRRYGSHVGLAPDFEVVDGPTTLVMLRARLAEFDASLSHLGQQISLDAPLPALRGLLEVASRAKDDLIDAEEFARRAAALAEDTGAARRQAAFYSWYQRTLESAGAIDYGDLIGRTCALCRDHPPVLAELQGAYWSVLVDEYQDLNLACSTLLHLLAPGDRLWAVGDPVQSIYRWRGARPEALSLLGESGPTALPSLSTNYRALPSLVRLCGGLAAAMEGWPIDEGRGQWQPVRTEPAEEPRIVLAVSEDEEAEIDGLARQIRAELADGRKPGDVAILCATHSQVTAAAAGLEARGIPVDRADRAEDEPLVRAGLALLAAAAGDAEALLRLADAAGESADRGPAHDPCGLTSAAMRRIVGYAREQGLAPHAALRTPPAEVDPPQRAAAQRLAALVRATARTAYRTEPGAGSTWAALAHYLFDVPCAAARRPLAEGNSRALAALAALLAFARRYDRQTPSLRETTLPLQVRLVLAGGESLSAGMSHLAGGGVQALTMHASKGLEFPVVCLPNLAHGRFPARGRGGERPAPGILNGDDERARADDDRCLFFVAVSRARDRLILSRATHYNGRACQPSIVFSLLEPVLAREPVLHLTWSRPAETIHARPPAAGMAAADAGPSAGSAAHGGQHASDLTVDMYALETYLGCPRRYYYEHVLMLRGSSGSRFPHFHRALRRALARLHGSAALDDDTALAVLDEEWQRAHEPHPYERLYLERARRAVTGIARATPAAGGSEHQVEREIARPRGAIRVHIDRLDRGDDGTPVAIRYRTGRPSDDHRREHRTALYRVALSDAETPVRVRQEYLLAGEADEQQARPATLAQRLEECDAALDAIQRGDFAPRRTNACPLCPFWLICPTG